jgi:hypothetical protein
MGPEQKNEEQATEMKYLRAVKGLTKMDRVRNTDVREDLDTEGILQFIEGKQLGWWGHMQRMTETRQVKRIWEARNRIRRGRGRPAESWDSAVGRAIVNRGKTVVEAKKLASRRKEFSAFVNNTQ